MGEEEVNVGYGNGRGGRGRVEDEEREEKEGKYGPEEVCVDVDGLVVQVEKGVKGGEEGV